jgi:hypothetical protein
MAVPIETRRPVRADTYIFFFVTFAIILVLGHSPYFELPLFWDELGQFVPSALDLMHDGSLVPHSAVPNVHPPGVMAWLAAIWSFAGYSIPATRAAMLALACFGAMWTFLLAIQLCRGLGGAPAFFAVLLLLIDPLFYMQSMMAQLDMPAMVLTAAGLLFFLQDRHRLAALACTALVLTKETGIVLPLICGGWLVTNKGKEREAIWYVAPFVVLGAWLALLWHTTGYLFGDPGFTHYNLGFALHPVRASLSILRHVYYLFFANFRWIGTLSVVYAWRRGMYSGTAWRITGLFCAAHMLLVSVLGGAELERYLLPVLPIFYTAVAAAWTLLAPHWRNLSLAAMSLGLLSSLFINPPYPFPFENNLAMADFVELHKSAAEFLEQHYAGQTVYTAWPLTAALRRPEFGYVDRALATQETSDLHRSTLRRLNPSAVKVLVLYSRTWEPEWGLLQVEWVRQLLSHFYEYEPQMTAAQCRDVLGLRQVMKWTRRGQWVEIYAREGGGVFQVRMPGGLISRKPFWSRASWRQALPEPIFRSPRLRAFSRSPDSASELP